LCQAFCDSLFVCPQVQQVPEADAAEDSEAQQGVRGRAEVCARSDRSALHRSAAIQSGHELQGLGGLQAPRVHSLQWRGPAAALLQARARLLQEWQGHFCVAWSRAGADRRQGCRGRNQE